MYSEELISFAVVPSSNASLTALSLVGSTGDYAKWYVMAPTIEISRLLLIVSTTTLTGTAAPVVTFYARPTFGSTSGQITLGTITVPSASVAGAIIYKNIESVKIPAGYTIVANLSTAGTDGGSAAGAGFVGFNAFMASEDPRNVAVMVASA